jgi:hypothetical protein
MPQSLRCRVPPKISQGCVQFIQKREREREEELEVEFLGETSIFERERRRLFFKCLEASLTLLSVKVSGKTKAVKQWLHAGASELRLSALLMNA